jgi:hypothetical protein
LNKLFCNPDRSGHFRAVTVIVLTVAATLAVVPTVTGTSPYLPTVGPAPLRFESAPAVAPAWRTLRLTINGGLPLPVRENPPAATNDPALNTGTTNAVPQIAQPAPAPIGKLDAGAVVESVMSPRLPGDSVDPVSAQMLIEFFKPAPVRTNSAGAFNSGAIKFTPPAPKAGPESRSANKTP